MRTTAVGQRLRRVWIKAVIVTVPFVTGVLMRVPPLFMILATLLLAMRFWPPSSSASDFAYDHHHHPPFESSSRT